MAFPAFLAVHFDEARLAAERATLAAVDAQGVLVWTNPAWADFARANGGEVVLACFRPGASYLGGITPPLRDYYASAFANALLTGEPFLQEYECSSPRVFRAYHLRALPVDGCGLLLEHSLIEERPQGRPPAPPDPARYRSPEGLLVQCANCRRFRRADRSAWDWVPRWLTHVPHSASHGICAECIGFYWGRAAGPTRRPARRRRAR